jgi:hypothetical protein
VVGKLKLTVRGCRDGEVLVGGNQCAPCPDGSYSLHYSPTATCTACPVAMDACSGANIVGWRQSAYWATYPTSPLPCPLPYACNTTSFVVTKYSAVLGPAPTVSLVDYFGGGKTAHDAVSATVVSYSCGSGLVGYLSGVSQVTATAGVAVPPRRARRRPERAAGSRWSRPGGRVVGRRARRADPAPVPPGRPFGRDAGLAWASAW